MIDLLHAVAYYSRLPPRVPVHFDGSGTPDRWSSKRSLAGTYMGLAWGMTLLWTFIGVLITRVPDEYINLGPYKQHWLSSPANRAEAFTYILVWLFLVGAATNAFCSCTAVRRGARACPFSHSDHHARLAQFSSFSSSTSLRPWTATIFRLCFGLALHST